MLYLKPYQNRVGHSSDKMQVTWAELDMGKCTSGAPEGQLMVAPATGCAVPGYIRISFHPYLRDMEKARESRE